MECPNGVTSGGREEERADVEYIYFFRKWKIFYYNNNNNNNNNRWALLISKCSSNVNITYIYIYLGWNTDVHETKSKTAIWGVSLYI